MENVRDSFQEIEDRLEEISDEIRSGLSEIAQAHYDLKHILNYEKKHIPANLLDKFEEIFKNLDSGLI